MNFQIFWVFFSCFLSNYYNLVQAAIVSRFRFEGLQYTFHNATLTFEDAQKVCKSNNGELVHVTNRGIQLNLTNEIERLNLTQTETECKFWKNGFWTGGINKMSRVVDGGKMYNDPVWMWGNGSKITNVTSNWAKGEPNDRPMNMSALQLIGQLDSGCRMNKKIGQWVDIPKNYLRNFICQKDFNECSSLNKNNCHPNAACINTMGSFNCSCNHGYTGDGVNCTDINECTERKTACHFNANCTNTEGYYSCLCHEGYTGDGFTCTNINECELMTNICDLNANCTNTNGSFICACNTGYTGNGVTCTDINECDLETDNCDRKNGHCLNNNGSYSCQCSEGYMGDGVKCEDINECEQSPGICGDNRTCINIPESYQCICERGFKGDSVVRCRGFCQAMTINGFDFGLTRYGEIGKTVEKCNNGIPKAIVICQEYILPPPNNTVYNFDESTFRYLDCNKTIANVLDLTPEQLTKESVVELFGLELEIYTSVFSSNLTASNIETSIGHISGISGNVKEGVLPISVNTLNSFFQASSTVTLELPNQEVSQNVDANLTQGLSTFLQYVNVTEEGFELETSAMVVRAKEVDINRELRYQTFDNDGGVNVIIPGGVLRNAVIRRGERVRRQTDKEQLRSSFLFYKNDNLFKTENNVSSVLSIDLGQNLTIRNLEEPILIQHKSVTSRYGTKPMANTTLKLLRTTMQCVFWDFETSEWSSEGCCLNANVDPPQCSCDHLTNFAIIVKSDEIPADVALSVVSLIGSILSIIGLFLTLVLSVANRDARKRKPTKILLNICLNLFIGNIIFVTGVTRTENKSLCTAIAIFMQYFFLVTWCWMAAYSYEMYMSLVKVFRDSVTFYLQRLAVFAYVTPALIVITNIGITLGYLDKIPSKTFCNQEKDPLRESTYLANNSCWLRGYSLYIGFLLPIGLILVYNLFVFIMVFRDLTKNKSSQSSNLKRSVQESFPIAVSMTAIMGLTWVFGFLLLVSDDAVYVTVLAWLFAVTNTLQGFTIFILTCVKSQSMRQFWFQPIYRFVTSAVNTLSTTSTNDTNEHNYNKSISSGGSPVSKSLRKSQCYNPNNSVNASYTPSNEEQNKV